MVFAGVGSLGLAGVQVPPPARHRCRDSPVQPLALIAYFPAADITVVAQSAPPMLG